MIHDSDDDDDHNYADDREMDRREAEFRANPPTYSLAERLEHLSEVEEKLVTTKADLDRITADEADQRRKSKEFHAANKAYKRAKARLEIVRTQIGKLAISDLKDGRGSVAFD